MRAVWCFAAAYAAALMLLAPHLSYWLDEVLTLMGAVEPDLASLMENLRKQQGATPLAFLIPHWTIGVTGLSALTARLPSIIASAASLPAMYWLARRAGLPAPALAVVVFALWPLQLRYALEARPYAMALCLAMWLTVAFWGRAHGAVYVLLTVAIGLTHPYSLVIPAAHLLWSVLQDRSRAVLPAAALLAAGAVLAPWYAHFSEGWREQSALQQLARWNPRAALVFVREISGSGYVGAALLLAGIVLGRRAVLGQRRFWVVLAVFPLFAIPTANVAFDYFFAIRQLVYVVPALVLLFCAAPRWVVAVFLVVSLYSDVAWYLRPREDWSAASDAIVAEASETACVQFVGDSQKLFVFFRPELARRLCDGDAPRVVLAGSTYEVDQTAAQAALVARGLHRVSERRWIAPIIEVYSQ
jgi:hypothetical protein